MKKENDLIIKNSGILFVRLLLSSIIGLFTSRFVFQSLGIDDFGLYNVVGGIVVLMAFLNTVMVTTTYRFLAFEMGKSDYESVNRIFNISFIIHLILALLVLILTETIGVFYVNNYLNVDPIKINDAIFVLRFSSYATVFSIISIPYQGLLTAKENFLTQAIIEIIRSVLSFLVAVVIIYYIGNKLMMYSFLVAVINVVPPLLIFSYSKKHYAEIIKWNFQKDIRKYREMLSFSGWVLLGASASVGQNTGSSLIINNFFGTKLNAAFGIANQVNNIVLMFARNLGQAAIPQITKKFSEGDLDRSTNLVAYISKFTFFLMMIPALPILLETEFLLTIWLGKLPPYTVLFCQLIIINALVNSLFGGVSTIIHAQGNIKYFQIIGSAISLISLPIGYILFVSGYSPSSILYVYIFTSLFNLTINQFLLNRLINLDVTFLLKKSYLKVIYVVVIIAPIFIIKDIFAQGFTRFVLLSISSLVFLGLVIYFAGIEKKEKQKLNQLFSNFVLARKNENE